MKFGLCDTNLTFLLPLSPGGGTARPPPEALTTLLGDAVHDPVGRLVANLPRQFGQPLLGAPVAARMLAGGEQGGGAPGQGLVLHAVVIDHEDPPSVLLQGGGEIIPILL